MTPHRILIADDDPHFRDLVEHLLRDAGFDVRAVRDGTSALAFITNQRVDLLLLDGAMPDIDGFEVLRKLRANPRTRALPVVMLTALRRASDLKEAVNAGVTDYVMKPVSPRDLVARIKANLREDRVVFV